MPSVKASLDEIDEGSQRALAEAISNLDAVDAQSVAGLLDAYLDAAISSRSNHDWDPQDRIDAAVSSRSSHQWDPDGVIPTTGTVAKQSDTGGGTDWSSQTAVPLSLPAQTTKNVDPTTGSSEVTALSVSGSGYVQWESALPVTTSFENNENTGEQAIPEGRTVEVRIDGTPIFSETVTSGWVDRVSIPSLSRFESELKVVVTYQWSSDSDSTDTDITATLQRTDSAGDTNHWGSLGVLLD